MVSSSVAVCRSKPAQVRPAAERVEWVERKRNPSFQSSKVMGIATLHPSYELKCRSCRNDRYAPPVRMIKLTEQRQITSYKWVHPNEER